MTRRVTLILMLFIVVIQAFPRESDAFWWLFKKKKQAEQPAPLAVSYALSSSEYRHDYGDAVRVTGSDHEFVICESCPKATPLERLPKPVTIAIRTTTPMPIAVEPSSMRSSGTTTAGHSPEADQASSIVAKTEKMPEVKFHSDNVPAEQSSPTPTSLHHEQSAANARISNDDRVTTIYFPLNSSFISPAEKQKLLYALESLKGRSVRVTGYTCELGSKEHNDRLALSRAEAAAEILEANGIKPAAVTGEGKCCYVSGDKEMNRRAEIREIDQKEGS